MDMRKLVGRNLRKIRHEKGLTQEQFAERSGFTQQYLSGLEQGRRNPTILSLYELALALEVDHVALVTPDEEARQEEAHRMSGGSSAPRASRVRRDSKPTRRKAKPSDGKKARAQRREG
jgi:transcriptional regulator with XRE-family HTH domain